VADDGDEYSTEKNQKYYLFKRMLRGTRENSTNMDTLNLIILRKKNT
jgi:hypothetical protein